MRRVLVALMLAPVLTVLPSTAGAQQPGSNQPEGVVLPRKLAAGATPADASTAAEPQAASQSQERARRRPSMVGYIGDSTIASKVRIRFDTAYHLDAADRAEFFYAKCGCYRFLPANNPAYDPNAAGPGPGVLTDANFQQLYVYGEYAIRPRLSIVGDLPLRFLQPQTFVPGTGSFGDSSGISDVRAGVKLGVISTTVEPFAATMNPAAVRTLT